MAEIKLNKRYKYAGDIVKALLNHLQWTLQDVTEFMNSIEDADVVEVVRCKNCKFNVANMEKDPLDITDYSGDDIVCSYFMTDGLDPNDYCSQGKRTPQKEG